MGSNEAATDLDLVRRIKAGDDQAFEEMVKRYHARVYSLSYGVLRNPQDAEEATQDAFLTLYRKIGTFDESRKFFSWFYRVALNSAYSRARRRPALPTIAIEDDVAARELAARAGEFIGELPPAYRDVIWMNDVEGMAPPEIAETLEISIPAFKSRLHRARLSVRQKLSEVAGARLRAQAAG